MENSLCEISDNCRRDDAREMDENVCGSEFPRRRDEIEDDEVKEPISNIPSLVVALSAALSTGGTTYSFSLYASSLQNSLNLSPIQVDTISTAFFFAGLFSFIPGFCSDRFGIRVSIVAGGCLGCTNLLFFWAVARKYIVMPQVIVVPCLSVLGILIFLSNALVSGGVFKTLTIACQRGANKGTAVGIAKGYVGLGSGLYVAMFESMRHRNESELDFLLMAASICIFVVALPAFAFLPNKLQIDQLQFCDDTTNCHFKVLYASLILMAILIAGNSLMLLFQERPDFEFQELFMDETLFLPAQTNHDVLLILLICTWLIPIYSFFLIPRNHVIHVQPEFSDTLTSVTIPEDATDSLLLTSGLNDSGVEQISLLEHTDNLANGSASGDEHDNRRSLRDPCREDCDVEPLQSTAEATPSDGDVVPLQSNAEDTPSNGDVVERNLIQMLRSTPALLMLWTATILVGAGTLESNNMSQMVQALGFRPELTEISITLFSVAQAASRVITGTVSEQAKRWKNITFCVGGEVGGVPRPFFFVVASLLGVVTHITLAAASSENVFVLGVVMAGAAFGMVWPLMVLITGEVFGANNVGGNYMFFDGFTSAIGTLLISKILSQDVYEAHVSPSKHPDGISSGDNELICLGKGCFQETHWIVAGLSMTSILSSIALQYFTNHIYGPNMLTAQQNAHIN